MLKDHAAVVIVLLEAGVEPDTIKTKDNHGGLRWLKGGKRIITGECAITYAAQGGHTETVRSMIPFCTPEMLERLLCECCHYGSTNAALAIMGTTYVSSDATYQEATALYFACGSINAKIAKALIDRGANVHKTST